MKMFRLNNISKGWCAFLIACLVIVSSCKDALDLLPEDKLDKQQVYNTLADADAAVMGIYGQFSALGAKYILWNELRADLMDVTQNANPYLKDLSEHNVSDGNPYVDPTDFYRVILNCNDAIKNLKIMAETSKLSQENFNQRYSDLVTLRSFIYLQLGIHFGNIPYVIDPIESVDDLKASNSYPKISLDKLVDTLINATSNLPYTEFYAYPLGSSMNFTADGSTTRKIFINKPQFIGELYLWDGNYYKAAEWFKKTLSGTDGSSNASEWANNNRIGWEFGQIIFNRSQTASSLENSLTTGWRSLFAQPNTSSIWNSEWNWGIPYSNSYTPGNPFIELASKTNGGSYLIKPSQKIINLWSSQVLTNGVPGDARGRLSYGIIGNEPVITKLTDALTPLSVVNKAGMWNIYRAAGIHLKFAEAANLDGQGKLAYALLNNGIQTTFYNGAFTSSGTKAPASLAELNTQIATLNSPASAYYFDARDNLNVARGAWYRNMGIRGRAWLPRLELPGIEYKEEPPLVNPRRVILNFNVDQTLLEDKLIEEAAMELAFEGSRWSDLLRIALRRSLTDPEYLANTVAAKFEAKMDFATATKVKELLKDEKNWYLPFKLR